MTEAEIRKEIIGLRKQWQEKGKNPMVWNDGKPFMNNEFIEDLVALFKLERERLVMEAEGLKVDVRPKITVWNTHESREEAIAHNKAIDQVLKVIQANKGEGVREVSI